MPSRWALLYPLLLGTGAACVGDAGEASLDAGTVKVTDARPASATPDSSSATPDSSSATPDAAVATPDAAVATPDANLVPEMSATVGDQQFFAPRVLKYRRFDSEASHSVIGDFGGENMLSFKVFASGPGTYTCSSASSYYHNELLFLADVGYFADGALGTWCTIRIDTLGKKSGEPVSGSFEGVVQGRGSDARYLSITQGSFTVLVP
jgi:hypothetical protein